MKNWPALHEEAALRHVGAIAPSVDWALGPVSYRDRSRRDFTIRRLSKYKASPIENFAAEIFPGQLHATSQPQDNLIFRNDQMFVSPPIDGRDTGYGGMGRWAGGRR